MKIVIACDSFKGCSSASEVVKSISKSAKKIYPEAIIEEIPIADGGEGMVDVVLNKRSGRKEMVVVHDPLGREIQSSYAILDDGTAIIEMATASGLTLLTEKERNPFITSTYGTGELIRAALDNECKKIIVGVGGSATNDAGTGMARALGAKFLDENNKELEDGGKNLAHLKSIDLSGLDDRLKNTKIIVASDVCNPLCGSQGASTIYGPQKGATMEMVQVLDDSLAHFANVAENQFNIALKDAKGAGAGGGIGAGLILFCEAVINSGINILLDIIDFDEKVNGADLVITGEGKIDKQSVFGKVPVGIAERVKNKHNIPVIALVGQIGDGAEATYQHGVDSIVSIAPGPISLRGAMENSQELILDASERLFRVIRAFEQK